jgi:PAS domain S-box-containing protein
MIKFRLLAFIMVAMVIAFGIASTSVLYNTAYEQKRLDLAQLVKSQKNLIVSVAQFDMEHSQDANIDGSAAATVSQVLNAMEGNHGFGDTSEFVLGRKEGSDIIFLLQHRHFALGSQGQPASKTPKPIPLISKLAKPMQLALSGKSGTVAGFDYRGEKVLAAYSPIPELNIAIVAKIDIAEIRRPYLWAMALISAFGVVIVGAGLFLFHRISNLTTLQLSDNQKLLTAQIMELDFQKHALDEHAIVSIADVKGDITYVNDKFCDISGYSREELIGKNHRIVKSDEQSDEFWVDMWKTIANGATWHGEIKNWNKSGGIYWVKTTIVPTLNADGKPIQYIGMRTEITEDKKRQAALAEANIKSEAISKELLQFIDTANAPIFGIDDKGLVNEWNQTAEKITGFKKAEVLGQDLVKDYITEDYQTAVKEVLDNALVGKETANYEFPLFAKNGSRVMVLLNSSTRRNAEGKIIGVLGVGQDISEMDQLRTESEAISKELLQFIDTANAPIFGIDDKGLVNEWNQTAEKITGFKKAEVLGQDLVKDYITEDYQTAVKEVLDNALVGKETANYEFPLFAKNGSRVMVLLNSSTRRNAEGKIIGVLGVGQDISEMDQLRTELNVYKESLEDQVKSRTIKLEESLDREKELGLLKSRFVTMASHEFRTPLTTINATSDIILKYADKMSQDDINLRLQTIKNEVVDMTSMLEDVLILGKSDAQKLEYNPEFLDVVSLVKDIIAGYQLSDADNRDIIYHQSSPVIMLTLDKKWVKNIVINLISNAVKYSDKDTAVEVSINEDKAGVSLSFKDYGIGIAQEDIKNLFEPFYRASNVGDIPGTGLGLIVLQKAIELHNGKIKIESELGKGSNFIVTLPNV